MCVSLPLISSPKLIVLLTQGVAHPPCTHSAVLPNDETPLICCASHPVGATVTHCCASGHLHVWNGCVNSGSGSRRDYVCIGHQCVFLKWQFVKAASRSIRVCCNSGWCGESWVSDTAQSGSVSTSDRVTQREIAISSNVECSTECDPPSVSLCFPPEGAPLSHSQQSIAERV